MKQPPAASTRTRVGGTPRQPHGRQAPVALYETACTGDFLRDPELLVLDVLDDDAVAAAYCPPPDGRRPLNDFLGRSQSDLTPSWFG
jgi:hypothetical protein